MGLQFLINKLSLALSSVGALSYLAAPKARFVDLQKHVWAAGLRSFRFLPSYYRMNASIWQEGLLVDWLQKKIFDKWVRRFLVHSSYLVSERVIFDFVVRCYVDYVVWPVHAASVFDFRSVAKLLLVLSVVVVLFILSVNLLAFTSSLL